jgi:ribonuclease J
MEKPPPKLPPVSCNLSFLTCPTENGECRVEPNMKFKIHRGTKEIGGSCVEVWTGKTRIVVDFGLPLVNPDRTSFDSRTLQDKSVNELVRQGILPDINGLYDESGETETSILLSHAHQDHFGLLRYVQTNCPVYLGKATQKLIEITNIITSQDWEISNTLHFESGTPFIVGDIEITPYLMDHSAFDAYAFLIRAEGKALFYSGDFRIHGRKAKAFDWFRLNVTGKVDFLLLEGTTIGRENGLFPTESEIEEELVNTFKSGSGINLVYASGQNIDRLVSIYRACKRSGKMLAIDFYIANVLKDLSEFARLPYPSHSFPDIRVFFPYRLSRMITGQGREKLLYRFRKFKITRDEIDKKSGQIVMLVRPSMRGDLERQNNLEGGTFIYSMWHGYKKEKKTKAFVEYLLGRGMSEIEIHTSGHASRAALRSMVDALNPDCIVPIHTFEADEYEDVFKGRNVLKINDRETVTVTCGGPVTRNQAQ